MRLVVVRTGHVLDPSGGLLRQLLRPFKLGVGGPLAGGDQYMSWIHVDDEVGLILWAIENEAVSGVVNLTAPNPVTNRELSKALGRAIHRPAVVAGARPRPRPECTEANSARCSGADSGSSPGGRWTSATSSVTRTSTRPRGPAVGRATARPDRFAR